MRLLSSRRMSLKRSVPSLFLTPRLRWNLSTITPAHYIDLLKPMCVLFSGDTYLGKPVSKVAIQYVGDFLQFFLCLSVSSYPFSLYSPCIQTAAIVMASRKAASIS